MEEKKLTKKRKTVPAEGHRQHTGCAHSRSRWVTAVPTACLKLRNRLCKHSPKDEAESWLELTLKWGVRVTGMGIAVAAKEARIFKW